jgi:hypothetical protein
MGVAVDKSQLLTGQATQIVEQRASVDHAADWERKLRQVFPADNVDISPAPPDPQSGAVISNYLAPNTSTELGTPESTPNRDFLVNDRRPEPLEVALLGAGGVELSRGGGSGDAFP